MTTMRIFTVYICFNAWRTCRRILLKKMVRYFLQFLFLVILVGGTYCGYVYVTEEMYFYRHYVTFIKRYSLQDLTSSGCRLPRLDPWDERAKKYYFKVPGLVCDKVQPFLTEVTIGGILQWNQTEISTLKINLMDLECTYREFMKKDGDDEKIELLAEQIFIGFAQLKEAFVTISCQLNSNFYYYNTHFWIPPKVYAHLKPQENNNKPNVQIFMLDAMSQANFIRQLPSTYKVLTEEISSVVMKGLVKVGSNTYPNLAAMLTGLNVVAKDIPNKEDGFDDWPFVWKKFSQAGYVTSLAEDGPRHTAFNYLEKGFKKNPTDYYMRPFWLSMIDTLNLLTERSTRHCYGNIGEHELILNFIKQSTRVFQNYSYFSLATLEGLSHNEMNLIQVVDDELTQFFRWFKNCCVENTLLIVMGDHGNNFGSFRWATQLGRTEAAMPFFSIFIPEVLRRKYPSLEKNLRINRNRLASWYDVYDTLMDVVDSKFDQHVRKRWSKNGISLFYPHPKWRNCEQAGISLDFCPCEHEIQLWLNSSQEELLSAAQGIVEHVNNLLVKLPQCAQLKLSSIKSAVKVIPNSSTAKAKGFQNVYRLIIFVKPSNGLLEATMKSDAWSHKFTPIGLVMRVNRFGNSSDCIQDKVLSHYCCCNC